MNTRGLPSRRSWRNTFLMHGWTSAGYPSTRGRPRRRACRRATWRTNSWRRGRPCSTSSSCCPRRTSRTGRSASSSTLKSRKMTSLAIQLNRAWYIIYAVRYLCSMASHSRRATTGASANAIRCGSARSWTKARRRPSTASSSRGSACSAKATSPPTRRTTTCSKAARSASTTTRRPL